MLRVIASRWASDGHDVDVMSTQPSYKQTVQVVRQPRQQQMDGFRVRRARLLNEAGSGAMPRSARIVNTVLFSGLVAWRVLVGGYDVVMTSTSPPVMLGWAASMASRVRGAAFIYHCMDVHPEIGRLSGDFARPGLYRRLLAMDTATCRRAVRVVVLSDDMAHAIRRRPRARSPITQVVPNIDLPVMEAEADTSGIPARIDGVFRLVFTGNVGRFQALDVVVDALSRPSAKSVELIVMGDGSALSALRDQVAEKGLTDRVHFLGHGNVATARALVAGSDLCLVSLMPGVEALAFPSKTMTYLAEGKPVLAVVQPDCQLSRWVRYEGIGFVASVSDVTQIADVLGGASAWDDRFTSVQERARLRGPLLCPPEQILDDWSRLLIDICGGRGA